MAQHYSDPRRADDPYSLPDIEVFWVAEGELQNDDGEPLPAGWYWWSCLPGCMPDDAPVGPFNSEQEALADAQDGLDDDE